MFVYNKMALIPNLIVVVYVVASLILVAVLVSLLIKCKNQGEHFCTCSGMDSQRCADPKKLKQLYAEGKLTEYTIPANVKNAGYVTSYDAFNAGMRNSNGCN